MDNWWVESPECPLMSHAKTAQFWSICWLVGWNLSFTDFGTTLFAKCMALFSEMYGELAKCTAKPSEMHFDLHYVHIITKSLLNRLLAFWNYRISNGCSPWAGKSLASWAIRCFRFSKISTSPANFAGEVLVLRYATFFVTPRLTLM